MTTANDNSTAGRHIFAGCSFVLTTGEPLNIGALASVWTGPNSVVQADEFTPESVISAQIVQIKNPKYLLLVFQNRVQLAFQTLLGSAVTEPLQRIIGIGLLQQIAGIPFNALGLNFEYFITPNDPSKFENWNKKEFASEFANLNCSDPNRYRYGSYFSMDFKELRLKVDTRPVRKEAASATPPVIQQVNTANEWIHVAFNYHMDLDPASPTQKINAALNLWDEAANHTLNTIEKTKTSI